MWKKLRMFAITLIIVCFLFRFNGYVKGELHELSMVVYRSPIIVYVGESFIFQVKIHNDDTIISHNYMLSWDIDRVRFSSTDIIGPNETINELLSPTFSFPGEHIISLELLQDGELVDQREIHIIAIEIDSSLRYTLIPNPICPNSSFSLNVEVTNEGDEPINNTSITAFPIKEALGKIKPKSSPISHLGNITTKHSKNATFSFIISYDISPGVYSQKILVKFSDSRGFPYEKISIIPVEISSRETANKLRILELELGNDINRLKNDLNAMQQNMILIAIALLVINAVLATVNYLCTKRLARVKRRVPKKQL